ncbi:MAG TPA: helix-turn-helix transcriptional regulator, partial [Longimicrobiales bacterium]|nr:helix-turn-helix transcriptional regulator [Longimicrobiales bacterium]
GIVKRVAEITEGPEPSSGSLYLAISRLKERGLLEDAPSPADEGDGRRNFVRLTPLGRRVLQAETERLAGLVELSRRWSDASGDGG